jgi:hypothetical protein
MQLESVGMGGLRDSDPVYRLVLSGGVSVNSRKQRRIEERGALIGDERDRRETEGGDDGAEGITGEAERGEPQDRYRNREDLPESGKAVAELNMNRGKLVGAALEGRFEMVLNSALERTAGLSVPKMQRQRKMFESKYKDLNVHGYHKDAVYTNSSEPNSPVGVAVRDVLRSARSVTEELRSLLDTRGNVSLRKMYPFLDIDSDRERLASLRERADAAKAAGDGEMHGVLSRAAFKYEAIIERKTAERMRFSRNLAVMAEQVENALRAYSEEEYEPPPPPDGGQPAVDRGQPADDAPSDASDA